MSVACNSLRAAAPTGAAPVGRTLLAWVIQVFVSTIDAPAGDVAAPLPDLDRLRADAELGSDLAESQHSASM